MQAPRRGLQTVIPCESIHNSVRTESNPDERFDLQASAASRSLLQRYLESPRCLAFGSGGIRAYALAPWQSEAERAARIAALSLPRIASDLGVADKLPPSANAGAYGLAGDFVAFKLAPIPLAAASGGQRRFSRLEAPLRILMWEHAGFHRTQVVVQAGAGYVHESIDPISGGLAPGRPFRSDGKAYEGGVWLSRLLYQHTRWFVGGRYTRTDLPDHTPEYWTFHFGARMPLEGSRPR